mmetsp:Transcript_38983/g.115975  ORF Transcript_38983/g.115975 Transcript_38983/m.115975 type:complete len:242 (+) Transcript_38983:608-1333(+)
MSEPGGTVMPIASRSTVANAWCSVLGTCAPYTMRQLPSAKRRNAWNGLHALSGSGRGHGPALYSAPYSSSARRIASLSSSAADVALCTSSSSGSKKKPCVRPAYCTICAAIVMRFMSATSQPLDHVIHIASAAPRRDAGSVAFHTRATSATSSQVCGTVRLNSAKRSSRYANRSTNDCTGMAYTRPSCMLRRSRTCGRMPCQSSTGSAVTRSVRSLMPSISAPSTVPSRSGSINQPLLLIA